MSLHARLKAETRPFHDKTERAYLFQQIVNSTLSIPDYILLLKKILGFVEPIENKLTAVPSSFLIPRQKAPLLKSDLKAFSISTAEIAQIPHCSQLPVTDTLEGTLGYLYVMEGSTLGGQILSQFISEQLNIPLNHGCRYFYSYGKDTVMMWKEFCAVLETAATQLNHNDVVESAIMTFNTFYDWLEYE